MTADAIDPYPWFLNKHIELTVNDQPVQSRITGTEWQDHWRPLLTKFQELHLQHPQRLMVAIGGPPGTGKSILAAQLMWIFDKHLLRGCQAIALPMDGYHYSVDYLREHSRKLPNGVEIPLFNVKGAADTFDIEAMKRQLLALRARTQTVTWPGYSRISHDVIPSFYRVDTAINIVIVEGNYVLLNRGPYAGLPDLFDYHIYIDCPAAAIISNLMERHIRGGRPPAVAKEWLKRIDLPNARIAESTKHHADLIIERSGEHDLVALHWRGEADPDSP